MLRFLPGPEIFWLLLYVFAAQLGRLNRPPSHSLDGFIENLWFWIPTMSLLVFGLWWIPSVEKNWLLLRVWIFGLVGCHFVLERALQAYSQQGPGIGMGYLTGLILQLVFLAMGSIFVKIRF